MKIVGKAKGKAPKAWCLMQDSKTGHYYVGYDGYWPLHGSFDEVTRKVAEAKADLAKQPIRPAVLPEVRHPGWRDHRISRDELRKKEPEYVEQLEAHEEYNKTAYAARRWDELEKETNVVPLDYVPVFEDELRFIGYTRGRSSVTMKFESSNGQEIEFGPSGIDGLLEGIIHQVCVPCDLTGTYEKQQWDADKREHFYVTTPRGKGIRARFKFVKKGQNTYAELTEE